jgi:hypothetical protein
MLLVNPTRQELTMTRTIATALTAVFCLSLVACVQDESAPRDEAEEAFVADDTERAALVLTNCQTGAIVDGAALNAIQPELQIAHHEIQPELQIDQRAPQMHLDGERYQEPQPSIGELARDKAFALQLDAAELAELSPGLYFHDRASGLAVSLDVVAELSDEVSVIVEAERVTLPSISPELADALQEVACAPAADVAGD